MTQSYVIPYGTSLQVMELLEDMYPKNMTEKELSVLIGKSLSYISNITPTVVLLKLIEKRNNKLIFTEDGLNFVKALKTNDKESQRKIIKRNIAGNEVFDFVINLLQRHKILKNQEVGKKLSIKFNRNWSHPKTFERYGTCVSDIVAFAGYGDYSNGVLSLKKTKKIKESINFPLPEARVKKIEIICNKLKAKSKSLNELSKELKTQERRLVSELTNCVVLNFLDKERNLYTLSEVGNNFINPMKKEKEKKAIFRKSLLESCYSEIIYKLARTTQEIQAGEIGKFLEYELRREWSDSTRKIVGGKFIDWLMYGEIINRVGRGHYEVDRGLLEEIEGNLEKEKTLVKDEKLKNFKKREEIHPGTSIIFEIGKLLERTKIKTENQNDIEKEISDLISLCERIPGLKNVVNLIRSHYDLYKENKDPRIITPDLDLIDKILGGE